MVSGANPVSWVAHSQGGIIFTEAVRYHLENGGGSLDKHSVTFNVGANNKEKTQRYLPAAGIKVPNYNDHPFDLVPQIIGRHATGISNIIGSALHSGYVLFGSPARSPHTLPYQGMDNYVQQMPTAYQTAYKGANAVGNGINEAVQKTQDTANAAYKYVENVPSHIKVMYKLFKK